MSLRINRADVMLAFADDDDDGDDGEEEEEEKKRAIILPVMKYGQ